MAGNAARAVAAGLGGRRVTTTPAAVRVRSRQRTPRGDHAGLQHRGGARQPARVPLRRHRARAALRRPPGGRRQHRRTAAGRVRPARPRRLGAPRPRDADTEDDPAAPSARAPAHAGAGRGRRPAAHVRDESPTRDRSPTCAPPAPGRPATLRARTSHRFTAEFIETSWSLHRRAGHGRYTVDVRFPSWGAGATIEAVLRDGSRIAVGSERLPLGEVDHFFVRSEFSGYVVVLRDQPADATARSSQPAAQSSAPDPGPTLVVELARNSRLSSAALTARLTIAR